jgi:hypothetical protein
MDISVTLPETGAGGAAPRVALDLTPKEAAKHFDYVKSGTRRTMILLGDLVSQRMHFLAKLNYKVHCTARLGTCELCQKVGTGTDEVGKSHFEHYAPSAVLGKDRYYHQKVVILTDDMYEGREGASPITGLKELISDGPARGHAFELVRDSKHCFKWHPVRKSPRALAHSLPSSFEVLPWNRARFGAQQDPMHPLTLFAPFKLADLGAAPSSKPRELEITTSDIRTAEELDKLREMLKPAKKWTAEAVAAEPVAPAAVAPLAASAAPVPPPVPAPDLTQTPAPVAAPAPAPGVVKHVIEVKTSTDAAAMARSIAARKVAEDARRRAMDPDGPGRLSPIGESVDLYGAVLAGATSGDAAPERNGKHRKAGKGGAA